MRLIKSVGDFLADAGLPVGPVPPEVAMLCGLPEDAPSSLPMIAVPQVGHHANLLLVFIESEVSGTPVIRAFGFSMVFDRLPMLTNLDLAVSIAPSRMQDVMTFVNLANRYSDVRGALSWSVATGTLAIATTLPFVGGAVDAQSVEYLARTVLSVDSWVPDLVAVLTGRDSAVGRISTRVPDLVEPSPWTGVPDDVPPIGPDHSLFDALDRPPFTDHGSTDDWDDADVAPFVVDL